MPAANYDILGVRVDNLTMNAAVQRITMRAADHKQPSCYVVKPYVEFFDRARRDPHTKALLAGAWLRLPEGVSTQWAATYTAGQPSLVRLITLCASIVFNPKVVRTEISEKFGGSVFTWKLLESCEQQGMSVYLIGTPRYNSIEVTAQTISRRLPNLLIAGTADGTTPITDLATRLRQLQPDIILVGMGFPLQEEVMATLAPELPHGVLLGEGGTFDYDSFGGAIKKAPGFIQRVGLEWLWRLALEPSRIKRQLAIPRFIWAVYRSHKPRP